MEVNIERLIEGKMNLEGYFVCWALYNNEENLLERYCKAITNKIPTSIFKTLVNDGYLIFNGEGETFTLTNIELTDKFKLEILKLKDAPIGISFDQAFEQLREHYPTKRPNGSRLHQNLERCRKLYEKAVVGPLGRVDEELHATILQCVNFTVNEKMKTRSLDYLQLLPTYLEQKNWEPVMEDVVNLIKKEGYVEQKDENGENKTMLGSEDF